MTASSRVAGALLLALAASLAGCRLVGPPIRGTIEARSLTGEPRYLESRFDHAFYWSRPSAETTFVMSDVPASALLEGDVEAAQVVHLELLWQPKPGATPIDDTAINVSIRYVVIAGDEVGIYSGAGFARPKGTPGKERIGLVVQRATLSLESSTPGFRDLLSPMELSGSIRANLDPQQARRLQRAVSQFATEALGEGVIVRGTAGADGAG